MAVKTAIKKGLTFILPKRIKSFLASLQNLEFSKYKNLSFSQEGEDLILDRIFKEKANGFFIDIGAHHPFKYSNTFKFYLKGWRGLNIDATPESMMLFNKYRPEDINVEQAISNKKQNLIFYVFNEPALNTFDEQHVKSHLVLEDFKVTKEIEVKTIPLSDLLIKYFPEGKKIDFMSIDVEGLDLQVLKSNNWELFKPEIVLIEVLEINGILSFQEHEIYKYLISKGYQFYARTVNSFIFKVLKF